MAKKLTKKELKKWEAKIEASSALFEPVKKQINQNLDYYRGKQWDSNNNLYQEHTVDNMVFSNVQALIPAINFSNPRVFARATKKPYQDGKGQFVDTTSTALVVEMLANYYYKELKIKETMDKILTDALLMPWGLAFIGFETITEKVKPSGELREVNELIKSQSPYIVRIDPRDFRVDSKAKDSHLHDAEWIALRWVRKLDDVKDDPKFKGNTKDLKSNFTQDLQHPNEKGILVGPSERDMKGELKAETAMVEGWRIFDKKNHKEINVAKGHDVALSEEKWGLDYDDGFPVEVLYFNENPNELFPISDVEIYLPAQNELNRTRSLQLSHVKRVSERKYKTAKDSVDSEELSKLTNGGDGTIIMTNGDPQADLIPIQDATISQDLYISIRDMKDTIRELSSVEASTPQKFDTATEPALLAQGVRIKRDYRTNIFEAFLVRNISKLLKIVQQSIDTVDVPLSDEQFKEARDDSNGIKSKLSTFKQIVGEEEVQIISPWLTLSDEDIKGDFEFTLEVGSTKPVNQETRKQEVLQLAEILQGNPMINQEEGLKRLFEAFETRDFEKLLRDPEEVAQEQQASVQSQIETQNAIDRPAKEVDLMKTEMKTGSAEKIALLKEQGKVMAETLKASSSSQESK